eukprot:1101092-Pleurochrysis_carterae.AAC.5
MQAWRVEAEARIRRLHAALVQGRSNPERSLLRVGTCMRGYMHACVCAHLRASMHVCAFLTTHAVVLTTHTVSVRVIARARVVRANSMAHAEKVLVREYVSGCEHACAYMRAHVCLRCASCA